jgi:branched-chain amino acid transport system permease protein
VEALTNFIGALLIGIVNGAIYGFIGLGIVLIYKTQRVVNFAQGEFATLGAFMLYLFHARASLPYALAAFLAVAASGLTAVLIERVVIAPLRGARDVTVFVATAGVALFIIAVTFLIGGANILVVDPLVSGDLWTGVTLADYQISPQQLLVIALLLGTAGLLAFLFRLPLGRALLALSQEPFAVRLAGISVSRLSLFVWILAGVLAGVAGVAYSPTTTVTPGLFTATALFPALTATVLGGLTSLPGAFAGGIAVGIAQALAAQYARNFGIPGPDTVVVFVILLVVLFFRPQGLLAKEA